MMEIWKSKKFWRYYFYFVLFGIVGGGLIIFILKSSDALKVKGVDEKYIYYLDSIRRDDFTTVYVADDLEQAALWANYLQGKTDQFIGSEDLRPIVSFVRTKVLEYTPDSSYALVYSKYKHGYAPKIKTRKGYVPTFTLHDTLPQGIKPIQFYEEN